MDEKEIDTEEDAKRKEYIAKWQRTIAFLEGEKEDEAVINAYRQKLKNAPKPHQSRALKTTQDLNKEIMNKKDVAKQLAAEAEDKIKDKLERRKEREGENMKKLKGLKEQYDKEVASVEKAYVSCLKTFDEGIKELEARKTQIGKELQEITTRLQESFNKVTSIAMPAQAKEGIQEKHKRETEDKEAESITPDDVSSIEYAQAMCIALGMSPQQAVAVQQQQIMQMKNIQAKRKAALEEKRKKEMAPATPPVAKPAPPTPPAASGALASTVLMTDEQKAHHEENRREEIAKQKKAEEAEAKKDEAAKKAQQLEVQAQKAREDANVAAEEADKANRFTKKRAAEETGKFVDVEEDAMMEEANTYPLA